MRPFLACFIAVLGLALARCAPPEHPGTPDGVKPATAGTLIGAFIGRDVGTALDRADIDDARAAQDRASTAPIGQPVTWNNPDSGHSGTITPRREGPDMAGNDCRDYRSTVTVGGKTEEADGAACRQPDGSWKIINN